MKLKKIRRKLIRFLFTEQWSLVICDTDGRIVKEIIPPANISWADPFPVIHYDHLYIFLEEQKPGERGILGYIEMFNDLTYSPFRTILEKEYHLSWPNIFSAKEGNMEIWYMIPESGRNKTIDLYRASSFPDKWEYETTLIEGFEAADTEILFSDGRWWLFTSGKTEEYGVNNSLSLYWSDSFPSQTWHAHPSNPIIRGSEKSRNGGKIYYSSEHKAFIRPAQSCRREYGEHLILNKITELSTSDYTEEPLQFVYPEQAIKACCTHTWNRSIEYIFRDVKKRHFKLCPAL